MAAYNSSNLPQIYEKLPKKVKNYAKHQINHQIFAKDI